MLTNAGNGIQPLAARIVGKAMLWSGIASGIALTAMQAYVAQFARAEGRTLLLVMIVVNIAMLTPWNWRTLPGWLVTGLSVARGFHWVLNLMFGALGLLLLAHAGTQRRAMAFAALSLMFVLWAAAARRLTKDGANLASTALASTAA